VLILAVTAVALQGALPDSTSLRHTGGVAPQAISAARIDRSLTLDGRLDDPVWRTAAAVAGLRQRDPDEGRAVTESTEVRVVYDGAALYVGARLFDRDPGAVARRLARRDVETPSDEFRVMLDTYHDHRTTFLFAVSPAGVQRDAVAGDDGDDFDPSWDPVWQTATSVDSLGWTVELRIPFSQLRFSPAAAQLWGIRIERWIQRKQELALFPFVPKTESGLASRFAHLVGLRDITVPRPPEVVPYVVGRGRFHRPTKQHNPFDDGSTTVGGAGLDVKAGVTSNLTLDLTVNPDFGQVELDPSFVNLTEFEQFLPEHRPFFVEGADIFKFGGNGGGLSRFSGAPLYYYSRRVGRPPQGETTSHGQFEDEPVNTTILGAAKLSGKTANGWSIGAVEALTAREYATVIDTMTGGRFRDEVEPLTSYFTTRLKRNLHGGATSLGFLATAVNRDLQRPALDFLRSAAYGGGMDFQHRWHDNTYGLAGSVGGSYIRGNPEAIQIAQRSSNRYFQRPDSRRLRYDSTGTWLAGVSAEAYLSKLSGNWTWSAAASTASPGFEVNDLGFQQRVDRHSAAVAGGHRWTKPGSTFRNAKATLTGTQSWNYDGDLIQRSVSAYAWGQFRNFWAADVNLVANGSVIDDRLTRGGPLARKPAGWTAAAEAYTDDRRRFTGYAYASYTRNTAGGWYLSALPSITYRPSKASSVSLSVGYEGGWSPAQFVKRVIDTTATATLGTRYVFGGIRQSSLYATVRTNLTFSRALSLQFYAQPFTFLGDYEGFRELASRETFTFNRYGRDNGSTIAQNGDTYTVDPDGSGPARAFSIGNPDFRERSLRVNAVLRWEYRPGSTIFLVWSQTRSNGFTDVGDGVSHDFGQAVFRDRPTNVLLVKVNAWLRP
jgi:hypothetical protein